MPYGSLSLGCEEHLDPTGTGSLYNEGEADIVLQHVFSLIYAGNYNPSKFLSILLRVQAKKNYCIPFDIFIVLQCKLLSFKVSKSCQFIICVC
jgi:hypothetical protein